VEAATQQLSAQFRPDQLTRTTAIVKMVNERYSLMKISTLSLSFSLLCGFSHGASKYMCSEEDSNSLKYYGISPNFQRGINENRGTEIWSAWQKLRIICHPIHEQYTYFPNGSFCYFSTAFPKTGITSEHLFCSSFGKATQGQYILG
jgi:hypothetical protein